MAPLSAHLANALQFLKFYQNAVSRYDLHSPLLANWYEEVLVDPRYYYAFDTAEQLRRYWIKKGDTVTAAPIGAPSRVNQNRIRTTTELARHGSISASNGRFLFRMCQWLQPKTVLEMGTNLGLSTIYLRAGAPNARLSTLEGNPALANLARQSFELCHARNIDLQVGKFADTLDSQLTKIEQLDLLFLDGDHRGDATRSYIEKCIPKTRPGSCLIIDDIHWSADMTKAWEEIRRNGAFTLSIDLFQMGLLFVQPEIKEPIHLSIVPWPYKFWRMGFWS